MNHEVASLKTANDDLKQYGRRDCLEIKGIPLTKEEDTDSIIMNLADKVGVKIDKSEISVSHRLPNPSFAVNSSNASSPSIIVKFTRRNTHDKLYRARKLLKKISTKDLGYHRFSESKIYINESLTSYRKNVYKACQQFKKEQQYKYLWSSYGKSFLREDDDSEAILITSKDQLDTLY